MSAHGQHPGITPRFPSIEPGDGGYESFYMRAVDPERPRAVWVRHTVHKAPGAAAVGSAWVTIFDAGAAGPVAHKASAEGPTVDGWLRVGASAIGPAGVRGEAGPASWDLTWEGPEDVLRHLPRAWMYRAPLPRTKLESPRPSAAVSGHATVGPTRIDLDRWPGMVGHNWGSQHAERWIWLHGVLFDERPDAWLDLSLGRVRLGPVTTPWIAAGVVSLGGRRIRLGGPANRPRVDEDPQHLDLVVAGKGARLELAVRSVPGQIVVWRYADPDGAEHHVANCSIAAIEGVLHLDGEQSVPLRTSHGGAYELGMRETTHGLQVQPFTDP
jgi:hypothetical protein